MQAQRWWALVVLAAVFALHGVQCSDGAPATAGHTTTHGVHATAALLEGPTATSGAETSTQSPTVHGHSADASTVGVPVVGHGGHPTGPSGRLGVACLAVLAAGLVVLLALLVRRRRAGGLPARWRPPRRRPRIPTLPRPPDVYSLCVLRT